VTDQGPGVPEEVREQIFRPFVTTKTEGTGFGLAIARLAVQEHEGRIRLEAGAVSARGSNQDANQGATFLVDLPLHRPSPVWAEGGKEDGGRRTEDRNE